LKTCILLERETLEKQPSQETASTPSNLPERDPSVDISILLPVRSRPEPMEKCLRTLINRAKNPERIEVLIAFDDDDTDTIAYFVDNITPYLDDMGVRYSALQFKRLGYIRLNEYLNELARHSHGAWMFFWNDDAVMTTQDWDQVIMDHDNEFALLRAETNHEHPYAIFPIVPRKWVEITGHLSPHQLNDAWVSQVAWMLDIVVTIPVMIEHERYDLTGKNGDDVYKNRPMLEGNPKNPRDFNHVSYRRIRIEEATKLANHLAPLGHNLNHFKWGVEGRDDKGNYYDIWCKMNDMDPHKRLKQWKD
jgi:hypothetical protein